jgi:hypothetical protein
VCVEVLQVSGNTGQIYGSKNVILEATLTLKLGPRIINFDRSKPKFGDYELTYNNYNEWERVIEGKLGRFVIPSIQRFDSSTKNGLTFSELLSVIKESSKITEIPDNFDEEGSPGYTNNTWLRAGYTLIEMWKETVSKEIGFLYLPKILPGPSGSIDLYWKSPILELLVNVHRDLHEETTYYGRRKDGAEIEGTIKGGDFSDIVEFLHYE